jgi:hypothetical protein
MSSSISEAVVFIDDFPIIRCLPWELQDRFNDGGYWERAVAGTYLCQIKPRPKPSNAANPEEPPGTKTYRISFYEIVSSTEHSLVFRVHAHIRPDWSLGGRDAILGRTPRPDPKALVEGGVKYAFREPTQEEKDEHDQMVKARRLAETAAGSS